MQSGTISLFASVILAMVGAAGTAWILKHPGEATRALAAFMPPQSAPSPVDGEAAAEPNAEAMAQDSDPGQNSVTLTAVQHGHFQTEAEINGRSVEVLVDTGASIVALTSEDAERAGLYMRPADFTHTVSTANGIARVAPVTIDEITIGDITVRNVRGAVSEPGKLAQTLLGMSFLSRLSRVDMRNGALILQE